MSSIHEGQSYFDIVLETSLDLSGASAVSIDYRKPSGAEGTWVGAVQNTTQIIYQVANSDIDERGRWYLQAKATIAGRTAYGERCLMVVLDRVTDVI